MKCKLRKLVISASFFGVFLAGSIAYASSGRHPDEIPELIPHEPWYLRICWIAIGGIVLFIITSVLSVLKDRMREELHDASSYEIDDRWCDVDSKVVLDLYRYGDTHRMIYAGDDVDLKVTETSNGSENAALLKGEIRCHKSRYRTGSFSIHKKPGNLNDLLLKLNFEDGRELDFHLRRT